MVRAVVFGYRLTRRPVTVVKFHIVILRCCARHVTVRGGGVGWGGVGQKNVPLHLEKSSCYGQEGGVGWGWGGIIT